MRTGPSTTVGTKTKPQHQPRSSAGRCHQDRRNTKKPQRWRILAVLVLALLVTSIDHTIINVAMPRLVGDLGATSAQLQWIVASYTIVFAGLLLTAGSLGDRFSRRHALLAGLATFLAGSVVAATQARHRYDRREKRNGVGGA